MEDRFLISACFKKVKIFSSFHSYRFNFLEIEYTFDIISIESLFWGTETSGHARIFEVWPFQYQRKRGNRVENYTENNRITLEGLVLKKPQVSHELYGEVFHVFELEVDRLSESKDILCVTISERLLTDMTLSVGDFIRVNGQLRSYNKVVENRNKLVLTVFARSIELPEERAKDPNEILLDGFICKAPVYRKTPFGREITDILVAVNRAYNKSDYIPIIAWGRNARYSKNLEIGERIKVSGRLQSREYVKNVSETEKVTRVAYEVSISRLELVKSDESRSEEEESSLA